MSIVISGQVLGSVKVERYFQYEAPNKIRQRVGATVKAEGYRLERYIKTSKLSGQVLGHRSGDLWRSINTAYKAAQDIYTSSTGTGLNYGRAWEIGANIPARHIYPKNKQALSWPGARYPVKHVYQPARKMQARPYLKPALTEKAPEITAAITKAVEGL